MPLWVHSFYNDNSLLKVSTLVGTFLFLDRFLLNYFPAGFEVRDFIAYFVKIYS